LWRANGERSLCLLDFSGGAHMNNQSTFLARVGQGLLALAATAATLLALQIAMLA
jgi:hypothetical protein